MVYNSLMKIDQLHYFVETARQEHIGKAARVLSISPSAISHSIAALEGELGRQLFTKRGRRIALTNHGKLLFEEGRRLLREIDRVRDDIVSDHVGLRGHYRVGAAHLISHRLLTPVWSRVQNENPKLTAEIFTLRSSQVVAGIVSGELDFGICFNPQPHPEVDSEVLGEGRLLVAVRPRHPILAARSAQRLGLLSRYPAVLPKAFQGIDTCLRHPVFARFAIRAESDCLIDSYEVAVEKIRHSLSWGLLPDWLIAERKLVALRPRENWDATYLIAAVWPKGSRLTRVQRELTAGAKAATRDLLGPRGRSPARR
jgi:DNA-binding transcriptional LysR family regulator